MTNKENKKYSLVGMVTLFPESNYIVSLPNKMFEYMAIGLPVIASNFPLWREIIEDNNCGICVDPLDSKAIRNAIQYLIDNPAIQLYVWKWEKVVIMLLKTNIIGF